MWPRALRCKYCFHPWFSFVIFSFCSILWSLKCSIWFGSYPEWYMLSCTPPPVLVHTSTVFAGWMRIQWRRWWWCWRRWLLRKASGPLSTGCWMSLSLNRAALNWTMKLHFLWKNERKEVLWSCTVARAATYFGQLLLSVCWWLWCRQCSNHCC